MQDHIFRRYDIRGIVGKDLLLEEVYSFAQAFAAYLIDKNPHARTVVVGRDGRTHSPQLHEKVCAALCASGLEVISLGVVPTPVLYFALHTLSVDAGCMITASHNGPAYNGFKLCLGKTVLWGDELQEIKRWYHEKKAHVATQRGTYTEVSLLESYVAWLVNHFPELMHCSLPLLIDCANGATAAVLPDLVEAFNWKNVALMHATIDGTFPHHPADPTVKEHMQKTIDQARAKNMLALGFDGDGDRMAPITEKGELILGDRLLLLFSQEVLQKHAAAKIIFDVKCTQTLRNCIETWGGQAIMSPSGHAIIKDTLRATHALLAGELSCHFFFNDDYFGFDDGIYAALRLLRILVHSQKTLHELLAQFPQSYATPEFLFFCAEEDKQKTITAVHHYFKDRPDMVFDYLDGIRGTSPAGWFLVRASNTQPAITVRCESSTPDKLHVLEQEVIKALHQSLSRSS